MRITFCAYDRPGYVGGPNAGLRRLLPDLCGLGIDARALFLTFGDESGLDTVRALREAGVPCSCARYQPDTPSRVRWLLSELRRDPPDVFVPNLMPAAYFASRWLMAAGIPSVGVLRSDDDFHYGLLDVFARGRTAFRQSAWVCVSSFLAGRAREACGPDVPVRVISSSVPIPAGQVDEYAGGPLRLVYAGRLVERQKRITDLARALIRACREVPGVEARIYGDGPDRPRLERVLAEEGRGAPVTYLGRVDSARMREELSAGHVFVLLSDYEGMPLSLLEAMATGLVPVCLRTRSGVAEVVEHGVSGLLVDDRGDSFVAAISRLKSEQGLWQRLSARARARVAGGWSREACAARWAELLQSLHRPGRRQVPRPFFLGLPPVHPGIAREDDRISLLKRLRALLGPAGGTKP